MTIKEKLRDFYHSLPLVKPPPPLIEEIPDFDLGRHYSREEIFSVAYMMFYFVMFIVCFPYGADFVATHLAAFVGYPLNSWLGYALVALLYLIIGLVIRQQKINYYHKLILKANAYPCITGEIREMTEDGMTSKYYQLFLEAVRPLARDGDEIPLPHNSDNPTDALQSFPLSENDYIYLVTSAFLSDDHLLRQFLVISEGDLNQHMALTKMEDVFAGWLGVERTVSKINFVVPKRIQDQRLVMYITDSAVTVQRILNKQPYKVANEDEMFTAEVLHALTRAERFEAELVHKEATIQQLQEENLELGRELMRKESRGLRKGSVILTPEEDKPPVWDSLARWQKWIIYIIIVLFVIGGIVVAANYFGII